jgi:hypothetical protein
MFGGFRSVIRAPHLSSSTVAPALTLPACECSHKECGIVDLFDISPLDAHRFHTNTHRAEQNMV